jgi:signal transduction histidine kinase
MSHDLRAPLRAIRGFSAFLQQDVQAGRFEEAANYANRIERAARRMDEMVEALTRLSRAANCQLHRERVDMAEQAREAWGIVGEAEPQREVTLLIADLPPAMGDPPLLAQVWQNLLGNAFKYTAPVSPAKVGVDAFEEDGRQWYRVSDNGAGFDMSLAKHLFEPFRRLHPESAFAGTGIGLSIVRRIVRRHGGEIRARGNVGVGAVFEFTLEGERPSAAATSSP